MKLTVKSAGVIPTEQYGNYQPEYMVEEEFQGDDEAIEKRLKDLQAITGKLYGEKYKEIKESLKKA